MKINDLKVDVEFTAKDIETAFLAAVERSDGAAKVEDPAIRLVDGAVELSGKVPSPIPLMKGFALSMRLAPHVVDGGGVELEFDIAGLSGPLAGMAYSALDDKLKGLPVSRNGNRLIPDIPAILAARGIEGDLKVEAIDITPSGARVRLSGGA